MVARAHRKISLRLDVDLVDDLQAFADRERVPVSFVLRHLVLRFLRPSPPPSLIAAGEVERPGRFAPEGAEARRQAISKRAEREKADFDEKVLALFDGFRSQGLDAREAAKRTNFALKERNHPWATYEVIADVIRKAGRFRKERNTSLLQPRKQP